MFCKTPTYQGRTATGHSDYTGGFCGIDLTATDGTSCTCVPNGCFVWPDDLRPPSEDLGPGKPGVISATFNYNETSSDGGTKVRNFGAFQSKIWTGKYNDQEGVPTDKASCEESWCWDSSYIDNAYNNNLPRRGHPDATILWTKPDWVDAVKLQKSQHGSWDPATGKCTFNGV